MINSRSILLALVIQICLHLNIAGQFKESRPDSVTAKFLEYLSANRFQDLYLHCDRDLYIAGEDIFIKAFLFDRDSLVLSGTSSFAYVEILNPLNIPVARIKVLIRDGSGSSVLPIPDTLANGRYILRAYTSWMKNLMPFGCFTRSLLIVNPFSNKYSDLRFNITGSRRDASFVSFWPEGGRLIAGLPSRIGIYATDTFGNPVKFNGTLIDNEGKPITQVRADSTGLGTFDFTPAGNMAYSVLCEMNNSKFNLPTVINDGYSLRMEYLSVDTIKFLLFKSDRIKAEDQQVEILIRSLGKIIFSKWEHLAGNKLEKNLALKIFTPGINDIVVFDGSGKPLTERFIYINDSTDTTSIYTKTEYGRREKVSAGGYPKQLKNRPQNTEASVSISVSNPEMKQMTMNEHLLFGSEYRIEAINYDLARIFFSSSNEKRNILLLGLKDNMIQWENIVNPKPSKTEFPYESEGQYLFISSTRSELMPEDAYKPAFMTSPGKIPDIRYSFPDIKNRFKFYIEEGDEDRDIVIQLPDSIHKTGYKIDSPFSDSYIINEFRQDTTKPIIPELVKMMSRNFQAMKIYNIPVRGEKMSSKPMETSKTRFYGKPDQELVMKNYISLPAMQEVFFELIPGVTIRTNNKIRRFHIIDPYKNTVLEGDPLMLIDGVLIKDPSFILDLNPDRVEKIDIITSEYLVADIIFPGIINVITKTGDFSGIPLSENSFRLRFHLYDPPFEFKKSDYSDEQLKKIRIPDFRNTLFWSYNINPAPGDNSAIEFFTGDFRSDYLITVSAIDSTGRPISFQRMISVK